MAIGNVNKKALSGGGMDPLTGAAIGAGINVLGGLLGGGNQPEDHSLEVAQIRSEYERYIAEMQAREAQRQFNINEAQGVFKQLEQLPMRDQISYLVSQRLGMAPGQFTPRDIYNPSTSAATPQLGGLDLDQYRQRAAAYQPGMGGLDPVYEAYQTMGADLGYGAEPLMNQRGVFGGNRNPLPGQNYDASSGMGAGGGPVPGAPGSWQPPPLNQPPPPNMQPSGQFGVPKNANKYAPVNPFNPYNSSITAYKDPAKIATGGAVPQPPGGSVRYSQNYAPPIVPTLPTSGRTPSAFTPENVMRSIGRGKEIYAASPWGRNAGTGSLPPDWLRGLQPTPWAPWGGR